MSENTEVVEVAVETLSVVAERGEGSWEFTTEVLKKKNAKDPERIAFVPVDIDDKVQGRTKEDFAKFMGEDLYSLASKGLRQKSALVSKYAFDDATPQDEEGNATGPVDMTKATDGFKKSISNFTVRGESLADLQESKDKLLKEMMLLPTKGLDPETMKSALMELGGKMAQIIATIEERAKSRRKNEED